VSPWFFETGIGTGVVVRTYSTNFPNPPAPESPISEGGEWVHNGTLWTKVDTTTNRAFGTQDNTGAYDDSYAYLQGFPVNQQCQGTIHKASPSGTAIECEVLLRWLDTTSNARGYECNLAYDGSYTEIVRWNGAFGDFTILSHVNPGATPANGDVLSAKIIGTTITVFLNGVQINTATDSTWSSGNPGMGFYKDNESTGSNTYCFSAYSATGLP